ncbi:MAG: UMP kinase [Candidatus Hadarchaeales archaeon]
MKVTLCVGGAILAPEEVNVEVIRKIVDAVEAMVKAGHQVNIVVGGGVIARKYIQKAREIGVPQAEQDKIGIAATRLNAQLLISALGKLAAPDVITTAEAAISASARGLVPVMGGVSPGQTTDAVAAFLAAQSGSDILVFVTDVDGIYTEDPKKNPSAQKIDKMTTEELVRKFGSEKMTPGMHTVVDPLASRLIHQYRVNTIVIGEKDLDNLLDILRGGKHSGTTILPV